MTTLPTPIVDVGFTSPTTGTALHLNDPVRGIIGTNTIGSADLFTDISDYVVSVHIRRGATRADGPVLRYEAGTATIVLRNDDRRFDPTNLDGPYVASGVTQVEPMRAVRIRAVWDGVGYALFRGFTDDWQVSYDGPNSSYVTLTCFDGFGVFATYDRTASSAAGAGEDTGARIGRILDSVAWPAGDRMIDTGDETMQSTTLADNALSEMLLTADTELGHLFMDTSGRVRFRRRLAEQEETRSLYPLVCFGDSPNDGDTTVNLVTNPSLETNTTGWTAIGGVPPTLARSATRSKYGAYSLQVTWGAGGFLPGVAYDASGLTEGKTYTISVYVWVPTGSPRIDPVVAGSSAFGSQSTLYDQWERLTWTGTATSDTIGFGLWPSGSPAGGEQFWVDGLQIEEGATATDYVDGDLPDAEVADRFGRTTANGWGTADSGQSWTTSGGSSSDYSTSGTGHQSQGTVGTLRRSLIDLGETDTTYAVDWMVPVSPTGNSITVRAVARATDVNNWYAANVCIAVGGGMSIQLTKAIGGVATTLTSTVAVGTYTASTWWKLKLVVDGDSVRAKTWTGSTEPEWQVQATDTDLTAGTQVGVMSRLETGNTNTLPVAIQFDQVFATHTDPLVQWDGVAHTSTSRRLPELPCADAPLVYDRQSIANLISIANSGGTAQQVENAASRTAYLTKTYQRHDLVGQTDAEALIYAEQLIARTATPELRFARVELKPTRDSRLWAHALGRVFGDRIRVRRRPPGGGDTVEREAHIRGVEHDFTPDWWVTRLVLQQAPTYTTVSDTFTRSASSAWGTADTGQSWTVSGGSSSDYSVTGSVGRQTHTATNSLHHSLVDVGATNVEVQADVTIPIGSASTAAFTSWVVARCADTSNYYTARLDLGPGTGMVLYLMERVAGVLTTLGSAAVGTHSAAATWRVRFQVAGTTLRAKAWLTSTSEPASWQVTAVDGSLTAGTQVGVLSRFESGNTNTLPQNIDWDGFTAETLHAWT